MTSFNEDGILEIHHTADVSIRVAAGSLEQLFFRSASGMYILAGIETAPPQTISRQVQLSAIDLESLLVAFLSELLYFIEEENIAFHDFDLDISINSLSCSMSGSWITGIAKSIKAVTFHNLKIHSLDNGFEVTLVFDV